MTSIKEALSFLLFPSFCSHCKRSTADNKIFCDSCLEQVELISPEGRCSTCFEEECSNCSKEYTKAYLFSHMDPMYSLCPSLSNLIPSWYFSLFAAYALLQIDRLGWPSFSHILPSRPFGPSALFASSLCKISGGKKRIFSIGRKNTLLQVDLFPPKKRKAEYLLTLFS